jgi:hypothetical protein
MNSCREILASLEGTRGIEPPPRFAVVANGFEDRGRTSTIAPVLQCFFRHCPTPPPESDFLSPITHLNPGQEEILGETCYPSLLDVPEPVDVVDIFRRSEEVLPVVEQAVKINAKAVWMQQGSINEEAARLARSNGLAVVIRGMKIDHTSLA